MILILTSLSNMAAESFAGDLVRYHIKDLEDPKFSCNGQNINNYLEEEVYVTNIPFFCLRIDLIPVPTLR